MLGGVTVFLQGRMDDHVPSHHASIGSFVQSMVEEAAGDGGEGESRNHACHTAYGAFNAVPGLKVATMYPGVGDSGRDFAGWFSTLVLGVTAGPWPWPWPWRSPSDGPAWWQHGVFAIRTSRLLSDERSDASYRELRDQVDWHVNPEAGHFFERSWRYVFPPLSPSKT